MVVLALRTVVASRAGEPGLKSGVATDVLRLGQKISDEVFATD